MSQGRKKSGDRDDRIIALLNQLGERMVRGEQNRRTLEESVNKFDRVFSSLQDRAANGEKYFNDLQGKLSRTEEIERSLRERQDRLEREQKIQSEKLERAASLALKMEEALAQQARLARRLEKITQDRAHMLLKLERIEEAVVETQRSINSSTLLLTGQGASGDNDAPQLPAAPATNRKYNGFHWRDRALYQQVIGVTALLVLLMAGGWAAGSLYLENSVRDAASKVVPVQEQNTATAGTAATAPVPGTDSAADDITKMDDTELLERFDENPDALAAALNDIEPGTAAHAPENMEKTAEQKPAVSVKEDNKPSAIVPASLPQQQEKDVVADSDVESFISAQRDGRSLEKRILHDEKLPAVIKEIEQKAFEGIPEAQHDLAAIYTAGHGGVAIDYTKAAQWFLEAAANGVANARYNLGVLYQQGMGVEKDLNKAIGWYRAAAEMGHPEAQYNLGIAYIEGIGTEYNPGKAAIYFEQAARSGITEAAYNLGLILENGLLGSPSPREALYWYKKSADSGSPEAKTALDHLAKAMNVSAAEIDTIVNEMKKDTPDTVPAATPPKAGKKVERTSNPEKRIASSGESAPSSSTEQEASVPPSLLPEPGSDSADATAKDQINDGALVAQIQEQLIRLSLYPGPADGIGGPQTEDAIRAYQRKNGLKADGQPSQALLVNLLSTDLSEETTARN